MSENNYNCEDVTTEHQRSEGGQRWIRRIDENCWVSFLYRVRGGDFIHRWESALVLRYPEGTMHRPKRFESDDRDIFEIDGDWRGWTADMNKEQLIAFFKGEESK